MIKIFLIIQKKVFSLYLINFKNLRIMKKLFLFAAVAVLGFTANAQDFKVGAFVGLPIGDAGDVYSLGFGADVSALWEVSDAFKAGATVGLSASTVKSDYSDFIDTAMFLPVSASGRYSFSDDFTGGLDLGYAVGVSKDNDGGFYYAPRLQYGVSESLDIVLAYRGISADGGSFDTITLGVEFGL